MSTLILTRGIQASGKSRWAREWVQEDPEHRIRINRDDLRRSLFAANSTLLSHDQERFVSVVEKDVARAALRAGKDVVVDAMNLRARWVKEWMSLGWPVTFKDFPVDLDLALARNAARGEPVPEDAIIRTYKRFTINGALPPAPVLEKTHVEPYKPDPSKPDAWLVDIDGTLAHNVTGRSFYDWERVGEDAVDEGVQWAVEALALAGNRIILLSGRDESSRAVTEDWLYANCIIYTRLYMRPAGDTRRDEIVKRELFDEHVRHQYNVRGVFDDRPSVCRMWRAMGVKTFQVGDPHIEF